MDIKEFKQIHEYINSCLFENDDEIIHLIYDLKYDLELIKEKLKITEPILDIDIIDDKTSGK